MRQFHRTAGIFFAPFLAVTAVTGLLWAYAPYLYMKQEAPKMKGDVKIDENGTYLPIADVIRAAQPLAGEGKIMGVGLKVDGGKLVYSVNVSSKGERKEIRVDAQTVQATVFVPSKAQEFHAWVMRIHRLEFFGTKKELVIIPGAGLLTLLISGTVLWKRTRR